MNVQFGKAATYNSVKRIEVSVGGPIEPPRLLLRRWPTGGPDRWEVWVPGHSYTRLHGETVTTAPQCLETGLTLPEAKAFAIAYIEREAGDKPAGSTKMNANHVRRYQPVFITDTHLGCAGCGEPIFIGDDDLRLTLAWERLEQGGPLPYTIVHEACRVAYHTRYRGDS